MTDDAPEKFKGRSRIPASAPKMIVFTAISLVLLGLLASLIGNLSLAKAHTYYATFTDATGVNRGDRVRISGVDVGAIQGIEVVESGGRARARIEFTLKESVPLYRGADLQLRYENIIGQRYLAITEIAGSGPRMDRGGTFPVSQTKPALNLTELFNGFQPLFRAIDPGRINEFSFELVRAFQGEGGTMQQLARATASLTNALADRDQVLGSVITNLNAVMATVAGRDEQLEELIVQFRNLMVGFARDRDTIDQALPELDDLLTSSTRMFRDIRPPLADTVSALRVVAGQVDGTRHDLDASLQRLPGVLNTLSRTATYGSWFNFYACGLGVQLQLLDGTVNLNSPAVGADERETVCGLGAEQ